MTGDDLKRIFLGPTLFRLESILTPRLVPILYIVGLAGLLLWAVVHLFESFARNFGDGLWGLLEIAVFGLLGLIVLRIVCELLLVFFKAHETAAKTVDLSLTATALIDDVRDSIRDIADDDEMDDDVYPPPAVVVADVPPRRPARRTARRTPRPPKV
jgi:hypothetical protein